MEMLKELAGERALYIRNGSKKQRHEENGPNLRQHLTSRLAEDKIKVIEF